jgi:hypothetical protein
VHRRQLALAVTLVLVGCEDTRSPTDTLAPPSAMAILDGARGGRDGFYFLPPIVPDRETSGEFDASLLPLLEVQVCALEGSDCAGAPIATFTSGAGHPLARIRLRRRAESYIVHWHTHAYDLDPSVTYRITVLAAGVELGYADVDVVARLRDLRRVDRDEFVPLLEDWPLAIPFRIEEGAVGERVDPAGGEVSLAGGRVQLDFPPGAVSGPVLVTALPAAGLPPQPTPIPGTAFDFGPDGIVFDEPVLLTIGYDPADLPEGAQEESLELHELVAGSYELVEGSTVDPVGHTVAGEIGGFSVFALLANTPPVAHPGGPYQAVVGETVVLDGSLSVDGESVIVQYDWTVDGSPVSSGASATTEYTCPAPGDVPVDLVVTDAGGLTGAASTSLTCVIVTPAQVARAVADALGFLSVRTGAATREVFPSGLTSVITLAQGAGLFTVAESGALWSVAQNALQRADDVILSQAGADTETRALAYVWAGYAYRLAGENFCDAVIEGEPRGPYQDYLVRAQEHFTSALALNPTNLNLALAAHAGRAAVRLNLGDHAGAQADAQQVPLPFSFLASYESAPPTFVNQIFRYSSNAPFRTISVWNTPSQEIEVVPDPRTPWAEHISFPFGDQPRPPVGDVPWLQQRKFTGSGDDVRLATGREMALVAAEASLAGGFVQPAIDLINSVRSLVGMPTRSTTNPAQAWTYLKRERGIETWLEGRRLADLRRWDESGAPGSLHPLEDPTDSATYLDPNRSLCIPIP